MSEIDIVVKSFWSTLKNPGPVILNFVIWLLILGVCLLLFFGVFVHSALGKLHTLSSIDLILLAPLFVISMVVSILFQSFFIGLYFNTARLAARGKATLQAAYHATVPVFKKLFVTYFIVNALIAIAIGIPLFYGVYSIANLQSSLNSTVGSLNTSSQTASGHAYPGNASAAAASGISSQGNAVLGTLVSVIFAYVLIFVFALAGIVVQFFLYAMPAVIIVEGRSTVDAIKRSFGIVSQHLVSAFVVLLLIGVIGMGISLAAVLISIIFIMASPIAGFIVEMLLSLLVSIFIAGWGYQSVSIFYDSYVAKSQGPKAASAR